MSSESYTIVKEDNFIQTTRDSGYKSTASAISELADNAFQAGANRFQVFFRSETPPSNGKGRPKSPVVKEVVCADDGSGMSGATLRTALRFGGTTRFDDRDGLGRFGMGLPNASVSQCRRLEVYTWRSPEEVSFCYIDVDEVAGGAMSVVPEPKTVPLPRDYLPYASSTSGTLVVWKHCDRLDYCGREQTLTRELPKALGQTYRYYLTRGKRIDVNREEVRPFDPLFLMSEAKFSGATAHGAPLRFDFPVRGKNQRMATVTVRFSLLPEEWQTKFGKGKKEAKERGVDRCRGISIVRAGREVDFGYFGFRRDHWTCRWWGCEISFDPDLDELFGMTHTKQQVTLAERVRTTIENDVNANLATLTDIIVSRNTHTHQKNTRQAEDIAKSTDKFLRVASAIRDKSDEQVEQEVREYAKEHLGEGRSIDEVIQDIRERPFLMDFENLPGAPFYRVRTYGKSTVVTLNRDHPFFQTLYEPLCDAAPLSKTAVELLLFALAKGETLSSDDGVLWYKTQRHEWSQVLSVYLDEVKPAGLLIR